jgi:thiamine-phosphate pyrophosphorylase
VNRLALVTGRTLRPDRPLLELVAEAAASGVDMVQIREKDLADADLLALVRRAVELCRPHGCRVFVNGRFDVALEAGADGVHLPSNGVSPGRVRAAAGRTLEIGMSVHSLEEARQAGRAGADFVFLGPVFPTPSKEGMGRPLGVEELAKAAALLDIPVWAIGGIDASTAETLAGIPIAGVAVMRALLLAPTLSAAVGELRERLAGEPGPATDMVIEEGEESDGGDEPGPGGEELPGFEPDAGEEDVPS